MNQQTIAFRVALGAAFLFSSMLVVAAVFGVNPQDFERLALGSDFASRIQPASTSMRIILAIDALFIACYFTSTFFLLAVLCRGQWKAHHRVVLCLTAMVAVLDFHENYHLLSLLSLSENGLAPENSELILRSTLSGAKWALGHAAFFFLAFSITPRTKLDRLMLLGMVLVQLPVGSVALVLPEGQWLDVVQALRGLNLIAGFLWIALYVRSLPREMIETQERALPH